MQKNIFLNFEQNDQEGCKWARPRYAGPHWNEQDCSHSTRMFMKYDNFEDTRRVLCTRVREIQRFQSLPESVTQPTRSVLCTRVREIQRFQNLWQSVTQLAKKCDWMGVNAEMLHSAKEGYIRTLRIWASPNISEFNSAGNFSPKSICLLLQMFVGICFVHAFRNHGGKQMESQHVAQRRSTENRIFNYRGRSTSCALSALLLSQNSNFQRSLRSCLMRALSRRRSPKGDLLGLIPRYANLAAISHACAHV